MRKTEPDSQNSRIDAKLDELQNWLRRPEKRAEAEERLLNYAKQLEVANAELVQARELADHAAKAKAKFLSSMSHELRTPLNAIIGTSDVLWETNLSEEQRSLAAVLRKGGSSLLQVIDDILDISRLESGGLTLISEPFDLRSAIENVMNTLRASAETKGLQLTTALHLPNGSHFVGDQKRVEQILLNLVGNAIKFTNHGSVEIVASSLHGASDLSFSIKDTGIGIAEEKLGELFDRFTQVDAELTKFYGGTGLGLAISKQLITLMDGSIWVESILGSGSTFHFTLKLRQVAGALDSSVTRSGVSGEAVELTGAKILLVEDSNDNAYLIETYLKKYDVEITRAYNGRDAIDLFMASEFDLILMDIQMPEMDGYSATKWIRILEKARPTHTPIVALTAFAFDEDIERSFDAGCDGHLKKPIKRRVLLEEMAAQIMAHSVSL